LHFHREKILASYSAKDRVLWGNALRPGWPSTKKHAQIARRRPMIRTASTHPRTAESDFNGQR
jgi:hypothetical protein